MNISEETSLLTFKAICNFVNDLACEFGKRHKPLLLYKRLANHTQISHDKAIRKHISIFQNFCAVNRESITSQNATNLPLRKLEYSERVFIDMEFIFKIADKETSNVIWQHLLTISAIVDPTGKAKDILRKQVEDSKNPIDETKFINDIISKVQQNIKPDATPMEAISGILQSGVANELISGLKGGLQSGQLNVRKMIGAVQGVVGNLQNQKDSDPETKQAMGMLNNLISSIGGTGDNPPDLGAIMGSVMSMMTSMGQDSPETAKLMTSALAAFQNLNVVQTPHEKQS
jgi:hypothetical protein